MSGSLQDEEVVVGLGWDRRDCLTPHRMHKCIVVLCVTHHAPDKRGHQGAETIIETSVTDACVKEQAICTMHGRLSVTRLDQDAATSALALAIKTIDMVWYDMM